MASSASHTNGLTLYDMTVPQLRAVALDYGAEIGGRYILKENLQSIIRDAMLSISQCSVCFGQCIPESHDFNQAQPLPASPQTPFTELSNSRNPPPPNLNGLHNLSFVETPLANSGHDFIGQMTGQTTSVATTAPLPTTASTAASLATAAAAMANNHFPPLTPALSTLPLTSHTLFSDQPFPRLPIRVNGPSRLSPPPGGQQRHFLPPLSGFQRQPRPSVPRPPLVRHPTPHIPLYRPGIPAAPHAPSVTQLTPPPPFPADQSSSQLIHSLLNQQSELQRQLLEQSQQNQLNQQAFLQTLNGMARLNVNHQLQSTNFNSGLGASAFHTPSQARDLGGHGLATDNPTAGRADIAGHAGIAGNAGNSVNAGNAGSSNAGFPNAGFSNFGHAPRPETREPADNSDTGRARLIPIANMQNAQRVGISLAPKQALSGDYSQCDLTKLKRKLVSGRNSSGDQGIVQEHHWPHHCLSKNAIPKNKVPKDVSNMTQMMFCGGMVNKILAETPSNLLPPEVENKMLFTSRIIDLAFKVNWPHVVEIVACFFDSLERAQQSWEDWASIDAWLIHQERLVSVLPPSFNNGGSHQQQQLPAGGQQKKAKFEDILGIPCWWLRNENICIMFNTGSCKSPPDHDFRGSKLAHFCAACYKQGKGQNKSHGAKECSSLPSSGTFKNLF